MAALAMMAGCGGIVPLNTSDAAATHDASSADADVETDAPPPNGAGHCSPGRHGLSVTQVGTVYRFYPDGTTSYPFRHADEEPSWIDAEDCDKNIILQFTIVLGGLPTSDTFEAWAGTMDCSLPAARSAGEGSHCWQVAPLGSISNSQTTTFNVSARDIVRYVGDPGEASVEPITMAAGPEACSDIGGLSACPAPFAIYILGINPDGITADACDAMETSTLLLPKNGSCNSVATP